MTSDEEHGVHGEHVVEISNESPEPRGARRRSFATISVAVCLGLAGVVTAFAFVRDQSENAADKQRDALQREQLLDGWTTLGAVAAAQRATDEMHVPPAPSVANTAPATLTPPPVPVQNVIVVASPNTAPMVQSAPTPALTNAPAVAPVTMTTAALAPTAPAAGLSTPVGVPAPASAPDQTPPPGSPDTVLSPITYPASQACGLSTCNVDSVCCNVSCGICTAPGATCSQTQCG
jgi:hypothetical protein